MLLETDSSKDAGGNVVILDRDGTIVADRDYLDDPAGLQFLPGAADGLRELYTRGFRLVVVTNQSGIGRGRFSQERLEEIHQRLRRMVSDAGARLEGIYFCPHVPEDACDCRKPAIGLLIRAAAELGFEPSAVTVIGDKASDIQLGKRVAATTFLVATQLPEAGAVQPDFVVRDLLEAARIITAGNSNPHGGPRGRCPLS